MRVLAAVTGSLEAVMAQELDIAERAVTRGVKRATNGLKGELRGQVQRAGLGVKLAKAWRGEVYPKGGQSLNAAGMVFSKAPKIHAAYDKGGVIRGKTGGWLAIPTEAAGKRAFRQRITPARWEQLHGRRLRFVYRSSGVSLLVAEMRVRTGKRGGFNPNISKTARRTGRGLATVPIFILVRQVRLKKKLDVNRAGARWQGRVASLILAEWPDG